MEVKAIANEFDAEYIDTNNLFNSLTTDNPDSARWLWDGIHPTPAGHPLSVLATTESQSLTKH